MTGAGGRVRPWVPFVVPVVVAGAAGLALHLRDPHDQGSWGVCPSAALGFACPGCGSLRAVNLLTRGDLAGAASSNVLLVVALCIGALWWCLALVRQLSGSPRPWRWPLPRPVRIAALVLAVVTVLAFAVARNMGDLGAWARWLAP